MDAKMTLAHTLKGGGMMKVKEMASKVIIPPSKIPNPFWVFES